MWHITKREIYDNLNSLRFTLTTALLLALMVTNAVKHLREHPKRVQHLSGRCHRIFESLNGSRRCASLYTLAQYGPGNFYKKPSPLHFCANGGELILPDTITVGDPPVFMTDAEDNWSYSKVSGAYPIQMLTSRIRALDRTFHKQIGRSLSVTF